MRDTGRGRAVLELLLYVGGAGSRSSTSLLAYVRTYLPARTQHDVAGLDAHWPRHKAPSSNERPPRLENYPIMAYNVQCVL